MTCPRQIPEAARKGRPPDPGLPVKGLCSDPTANRRRGSGIREQADGQLASPPPGEALPSGQERFPQAFTRIREPALSKTEGGALRTGLASVAADVNHQPANLVVAATGSRRASGAPFRGKRRLRVEGYRKRSCRKDVLMLTMHGIVRRGNLHTEYTQVRSAMADLYGHLGEPSFASTPLRRTHGRLGLVREPSVPVIHGAARPT